MLDWKPGDHVVCVIEQEEWVKAKYPMVIFPQKGSVYTIERLEPYIHRKDIIGIFLVEIQNNIDVQLIHGVYGQPAFPHTNFRKLQRLTPESFGATSAPDKSIVSSVKDKELLRV